MLAVSSFIVSCLCIARSRALSPQELADSFSLTVTKTLEFPPTPLDNTVASTFINNSESWGVRRVTDNPQNIWFLPDPFPDASPNTVNQQASPSNSSATVLAISYPQGGFSHDTSGTQFNTVFDPTRSAGYQSMLLTYEVAFDDGFQFVKGGKLPGLRGGPFNAGCSGGAQPNGTDCFSIRLMWRSLGSGEVYAYIPTPNRLCDQEGVRCNTDGYGVSFDRATFAFAPSKWTRITMLVRLNDPTYANGELWVYYNDLLAVKLQNLYYRSDASKIQSVQGMYFSTFFGGNDPTWATPVSQNTYFRNIQMWAGTSPSNVTNAQPVKSFSGAPTSLSGLMSSATLPLVASTVLVVATSMLL